MSDSEELLDLLATATSASDQLKFIQTAYGSSGLVELSLQEADEILKKLGEGKSRKDQVTALATSRDERLVSCLMDVAMAPLTMTPSMLRHLERVIGTASVKSVSPAKIAHLLDQLEEQCFLSAAQATTLLRATQHRDDEKKRRFEYCHVICSRVIDRWNLTQDEHTEVSCYYGWSPAYLITLVQQAVGARPAELIEEQGADAPQEKPEAKPEEGKPEGKPEGKESSAKERKHEREEAGQPPEGMCWDARSAVELQNRVLGEQSATEQGNPPTMSRKLQNRILSQACSQAPRLMGRGGDHTVYALSGHVREYAARLVAKNLSASSSGQKPSECAICLDCCQDGTQLWTCPTCHNRLHAACRHDWQKKRKRSRAWEVADDEDPPPPCPYCRSTHW